MTDKSDAHNLPNHSADAARTSGAQPRKLHPELFGGSAYLADGMLADAVGQGWIIPPAVAATGSPGRIPIMSFSKLMREVEEDREDW